MPRTSAEPWRCPRCGVSREVGHAFPAARAIASRHNRMAAMPCSSIVAWTAYGPSRQRRAVVTVDDDGICRIFMSAVHMPSRRAVPRRTAWCGLAAPLLCARPAPRRPAPSARRSSRRLRAADDEAGPHPSLVRPRRGPPRDPRGRGRRRSLGPRRAPPPGGRGRRRSASRRSELERPDRQGRRLGPGPRRGGASGLLTVGSVGPWGPAGWRRRHPRSRRPTRAHRGAGRWRPSTRRGHHAVRKRDQSMDKTEAALVGLFSGLRDALRGEPGVGLALKAQGRGVALRIRSEEDPDGGKRPYFAVVVGRARNEAGPSRVSYKPGGMPEAESQDHHRGRGFRRGPVRPRPRIRRGRAAPADRVSAVNMKGRADSGPSHRATFDRSGESCKRVRHSGRVSTPRSPTCRASLARCG